MTEETIHESTRTRSRKAIASYLHRMAEAFDSGDPVPVEESVTVDPPAESEMEVEVEREGDELSLELEFSWPEAEGSVDTDAAVDVDVAADTDAAASRPATFELYQDKADEWRWRLRHANGNVIADGGEGYGKKANAVNGIESVKTNAADAVVEEQG